MRGAIAAAIWALVACAAPPPAEASFPPEQQAQMRQAVEQYAPEVGYPGVVAGVWQKGVGRFVAATGVSNLTTGRPLGTGGHHRIGSVTKTMTATLVLQLVSRGRLHLRDPISKYVDGVPKGRRITIEMLLNHTSGIHNFASLVNRKGLGEQPHRNWRVRQIIRRSVGRPRYCPPGRCWVYSNTNYVLLGKIVRRITDQRLRKLYERRIFDRLGMDDTSFRPRRPTPRPAVHGYVDSKKGPKDVTDWNFSWAWTAGGVSSTLADLRRWAPALATGRGILNQRMQGKRLRSVPFGCRPCGRPSAEPPSGQVDRYGLGILEAPGGPFRELYGHDGTTPGYDSLVVHSPSAKLTIVALGNTSAGQNPITRTPLSENAPFVDLATEFVAILAPG